MEVKPFKAYRYDDKVVGDVGTCISPPYDVISQQQDQLYSQNEYNIVRVIKGKIESSDNGDNNQYTRAAEYLNKWIAEGALKQDADDSIYGYVQDFDIAGNHFQRLTFIALAKLEEFGPPGPVRPHEKVLAKPMQDRLNLKRATMARFGLVFMLYEDPQKTADGIIKQAMNAEPLVDFMDDQDVRHRLYAITDTKSIEAVTRMMEDKTCIIADGHHRYTTGLNFSKELNTPESKYQMLAFTNSCQDGLVVLATHRLVMNLDGFGMDKLLDDLREKFEVVEFSFDNDSKSKAVARGKMLDLMKSEHDKDTNTFGVYGGAGAFYVAVLKDKGSMDSIVPDMSPAWRELDVAVLHKLILEQILGIDEEKQTQGGYLQYVKDTPNAIDDSIADVEAGRMQVAFFMNPIKMQQLKKVTDVGERMPQKSTYFYPKLFTGLTINKL